MRSAAGSRNASRRAPNIQTTNRASPQASPAEGSGRMVVAAERVVPPTAACVLRRRAVVEIDYQSSRAFLEQRLHKRRAGQFRTHGREMRLRVLVDSTPTGVRLPSSHKPSRVRSVQMRHRLAKRKRGFRNFIEMRFRILILIGV